MRVQQHDDVALTKITASWLSHDLEVLFAKCFYAEHQTLLVGGASEPLYTPWSGKEPAKVYYTRDYFRSALHEIAHWCIAGAQRRQQTDFGYWYAPEGRDAKQQANFEQVEVNPQALELLFCAACGHDFLVSRDDFSGHGDEAVFAAHVWQQANNYLQHGLPKRAQQWLDTLLAAYSVAQVNQDTLMAVWRHELPNTQGY